MNCPMSGLCGRICQSSGPVILVYELFDTLVIFAGTGIDADLVTGIDEQRDADRCACIYDSGFEGVSRSGIALHSGFGICHLHVDDRGEFGGEDLFLFGVEHHLDDLAVGHEVVVVDEVLVDVYLLECFGMHEVSAEVVLISELVGASFNAHLFDFLAHRRECIFDDATVFEVFEFGTDESGSFSGFAVLEIDYQISFAIHFDAHADFDVRSIYCHNCLYFSIFELNR